MRLATMWPSILRKGNSGEGRAKWDILLLLLLAGSLSLNIFLGWEIKRLRMNGTPVSPPTLAVGVEVPSFEAFDVSNKQETISCRGTATVLYIFSPTCSWCDRNLENIKVLAGLRGDSYRFIGLSLTDKNLQGYLDSSKLTFPIYTNLSKDIIQNLKLASTPQTIVVSQEGKVIKNWVGAYSGNVQSEIEKFFNVQLPGITSEVGLTDTPDKSCP